MTMYRAVMMDIPKDRMAGKRRVSFILFSRGRTYGIAQCEKTGGERGT